MEESEIQALANTPRPIEKSHGRFTPGLILNLLALAILFWLTRGWWLHGLDWMDRGLKHYTRYLGISGSIIGFLWWLAHTGWGVVHGSKAKRRKEQEKAKKSFAADYNPIEARDSESWKHE